MDTLEVVSSLKSTCIVLGVAQQLTGGKIGIGNILGTGFIIREDGFFVTASHVIKRINEQIEKLRSTNGKFGLGAGLLELNKEKISIHPIWIGERWFIDLGGESYQGATDFDVAVGRFVGLFKIPFLKIKKPQKLDLLSEIIMCGYPGGATTFNLKKEFGGVRTSPLVQFGRISSLMPGDSTTKPVGIQTDIVGTGGSSGSPIVDSKDGEVIGVAQRAVSPAVTDDNDQYLGKANIGLIWGVSNYFLYDAVKKVLEVAKEQLDEKGILKPEFKNDLHTNFQIKVGNL